ncbi:MAG TPA: type II toxin-antitoxin system MqsA family antitoxin [Planctomycetota bacterium]|jgi:YgiT-type zinc finger domain-containing protein|nr:type II toxin-antitoxin system MqsA family antitoxin [Planctomycetota bacterium]
MSRRKIVCDFCGRTGVRVRRATRSYGRGRSEFLIRNIPTISCPHCGETYVTAQTARELERIKIHRRSLAVKRRVAVADFPRVPRRRAG